MDSSPQLQHVLKNMAEKEPTSLPTPSACLAGKCDCYPFPCRHVHQLSMRSNHLPRATVAPLQDHYKPVQERNKNAPATQSNPKSQTTNPLIDNSSLFLPCHFKPLLTIRCIVQTTDFCLIPIGTPTASVSNEVAAVQRLLKKAKNIEYTMHSAGTTLGKFTCIQTNKNKCTRATNSYTRRTHQHQNNLPQPSHINENETPLSSRQNH